MLDTRVVEAALVHLFASALGVTTERFEEQMRDIIADYMDGENQTASIVQFQRAIAGAWLEAAEFGWFEGGGEGRLNHVQTFPPDEMSAQDYTMQQMSFGADLFRNTLAQLRDKLAAGADPAAIWATIENHVQMWLLSLSGIYNLFALFARGRKRSMMLMWNLGGTERHCGTCKSLHLTTHTAQYYIMHGYLPRTPGANMECGGWRCDCYFTDANTGEVVGIL